MQQLFWRWRRTRAGLFLLRLVSETGVRRVREQEQWSGAHDDDNDADYHEEDEAKDELVCSHATQERTHLQQTVR
jgi:hypothetical protein